MRKRISSSHAKPILRSDHRTGKRIRSIIMLFIQQGYYLYPKAPALTVFSFHELVDLVEVSYPQILLVPK